MFTKTKIFNFLTALAFSVLLTASIVYASTTISTDITTGGNITTRGVLTITGASTEAVLGSELIAATADRDFSSDTGKWTGTGWTVTGGVASSTAGASALTLDNTALSSAPSSGNVYQVTFTVVTSIAGTLTPSIGGGIVNARPIGQSTGTLTAQVQVITATGSGALTFTPNATWTGTIDNVSVKLITPTPALVILQNSDGTSGLEMRSGGAGLTNTFVGINAGRTYVSDNNSVAFGWGALSSDTTGSNNTAVGALALYHNTAGYRNTAIGEGALSNNTTATQNTATGYLALNANVTGTENVANGVRALALNTTGSDNTAIGFQALYSNTTGKYNTANGAYALRSNTTGNNNTSLGYYSGYNITTGSSNIIIGYNVNAPSATADQQLNIGNLIYGTGVYSGSSVSATAVTTGSVGISTSSPYAKLSVTGTAIASTTLAIRPVASQTANILDVYNTSGTLTSVINSSNNWGIGTTTPNWLLQVAGARPSLALSDTSQTAASNLQHWLLTSAGGNLYIGTSTGLYATSTPPALTILNSGNVGIGTSSPASQFQVSAGATATTTVDFGAQAVTAKTCFNVRDALGAETSFYFVGTTMVIEANRCK
jgi:hypothetical protein